MPSRPSSRLVVVALVFVAAFSLARAVDKPPPPPQVDKLAALPGTVTRLTFAQDGKSLLVETVFVPPPPRPGFGVGGTGNPGYPVQNFIAWNLSPRKVTTLTPMYYTGGGALAAPDLQTIATWHATGPDTLLHEYYDTAAALRGEKPKPRDFANPAKEPAPKPKGERPKDWKWLEPSLEPMTFSADGKVAAARFAKEKAVVLFDVAQDKQIAKIEMPGRGGVGAVPGVVFSDDGKLVAVPSIDGSPVRICEVAGGKEISKMGKFLEGGVLTLTPDGKTMALAHPRSGEVQLWDTSTGKRSGAWQTGQRGVNEVVFSGNGKVLFAAGDRVVLAWDVAAGREVAQLRGHQAAVTVLTMSADGQRLASGGKDKAVFLWDISAYAAEKKAPPSTSGAQTLTC